ncbi:MAG: DUF4389 domain-containing protein [Ilumatobacteraceae bacterium]
MNYSTVPAIDLHLDSPRETQNWRPFVNWLLAIPHLVLANALSNVASVLSVISWFNIVFTGKLPDGIARFQCMILRYEARAYSYLAFLRQPYPQFEFDMANDAPGSDPLRVDVVAQLSDRKRLTVAFRIVLIIPILIYTMLITVAAVFAVIVAAFAVLFTGRWPQRLREFVLNAGRLTLRVGAYGRLLTDTYPSFALSAEKLA